MARIRRWKETLLIACVTLFFSLARAWPLRPRDTAGRHGPEHSLLLTGANRKTALGVELMAQKPYVRLARASLVPVAMPWAAGAFVATAAQPVGAAGDVAAASSSACTCIFSQAPCCSDVPSSFWCCDSNCPQCWTRVCYVRGFSTWSFTCLSCGSNCCGDE
jgi:hypothetical protein